MGVDSVSRSNHRKSVKWIGVNFDPIELVVGRTGPTTASRTDCGNALPIPLASRHPDVLGAYWFAVKGRRRLGWLYTPVAETVPAPDNRSESYRASDRSSVAFHDRQATWSYRQNPSEIFQESVAERDTTIRGIGQATSARGMVPRAFCVTGPAIANVPRFGNLLQNRCDIGRDRSYPSREQFRAHDARPVVP